MTQSQSPRSKSKGIRKEAKGKQKSNIISTSGIQRSKKDFLNSFEINVKLLLFPERIRLTGTRSIHRNSFVMVSVARKFGTTKPIVIGTPRIVSWIAQQILGAVVPAENFDD